MALIHVGIRPEFETVLGTIKLKEIKGFQYEIFPDGTYKRWSDRMLKSGCGEEVSELILLNDLIYCQHCDEFFTRNQFHETIK